MAIPARTRIDTDTFLAQGRELLARLDEPVAEFHRRQLGHLGEAGLGALIELLGRARSGE